MCLKKILITAVLIISSQAQYGQGSEKETLQQKAKKYAKGIKTRSDIYIDMEIKFRAEKNDQMADELLKKKKKMKADMEELSTAIFLGEAYLQKKTDKKLTNFHLASSEKVSPNGFIDKFNVTILWEDDDHATDGFFLKKEGVSTLVLSRKLGIYQNALMANILLNEAYKNYLAGKEIGLDSYGSYYLEDKFDDKDYTVKFTAQREPDHILGVPKWLWRKQND